MCNVLLTEIVGKNEYLDFQFNENSKLGFELYLDDFISQLSSADVKELEKQIRLQKKLLSDYNKLREAYYIDDKTYWKYMDIGLDKLSALLKRRNKK